jgi:hypothetical protein
MPREREEQDEQERKASAVYSFRRRFGGGR